jgi:hypothetical protein
MLVASHAQQHTTVSAKARVVAVRPETDAMPFKDMADMLE